MQITPKSFSIKNILIIAAVAIAIFVIGLTAYTDSILSAYAAQSRASGSMPPPVSSISAYISGQNLLNYANGTQLAPYVLVSYTSRNSTYVVANSTLFASQIPTRIYFLNISDECFDCGNTIAIEQAVTNNLLRFKVIGTSAAISQISMGNIQTIQPNSILVVLNGLMPSAMFANLTGTNITAMQYLLQRRTSIIYAGQDFSHVLLPASIVVPNPYTVPYALGTAPANTSLHTQSYFFNDPTFAFASGYNLGPITYVYSYNGTIVAFPNTPGSWGSDTLVGYDISKAILGLFWLPKYASGTATAQLSQYNLTNVTKGTIAVALDSPPFKYSYTNALFANSGQLRTVVYAYSLNGTRVNSIAYTLIYNKPVLALNGTLAMPFAVTPVQQVPLTMTIFSNTPKGVSVQPHLTVYNSNGKAVLTEPFPFTQITGNFTFLKYITLNLPAGQYAAILQSYTGSQYGGAVFSVYPITVLETYQNYTTQNFRFYVSAGGQPISGIPYTMSLDGLYLSNGTLENGEISYTLPGGTPQPFGYLTFKLSLPSLSQSFDYITYNPPPIITINKQYVEVGIVGIIVLLMVVLVKAPNRDEFYIDVPNLPRMDRTEIRLKPRDVLSVFDKLNIYYHWRYMPLSRAELRTGIATNIRVGNMPVSLTYGNVEIMLDQLSVNGYVVSADELYAPKDWVKQSGHDIEYLAAFKKLRIYLVTHAYVFTDVDASNLADIVATLHGERKYIVIHSKSSKFQKLPIYANSKTYLVFLNAYRLDQFREGLYSSMTKEAEELKIYISVGYVKLIDADNLDEIVE